MNFDLCTIDWTAVGSIVTFVAMIIAYWTIHASNKQNESNQKFQLLLMQREIEQKRLDDLVESITGISSSIQPSVATDFSSKLFNGTFNETDREKISLMGEEDKLNNEKLVIQLYKYNKDDSARNVLNALKVIYADYGELIRDIAMLYLYKKNPSLPEKDLELIIETITRRSKEIDPSVSHLVNEISAKYKNKLELAMNLLLFFSYIVTSELVEEKHTFEKELYSFVKNEQRRIDKMIE